MTIKPAKRKSKNRDADNEERTKQRREENENAQSSRKTIFLRLLKNSYPTWNEMREIV